MSDLQAETEIRDARSGYTFAFDVVEATEPSLKGRQLAHVLELLRRAAALTVEPVHEEAA